MTTGSVTTYTLTADAYDVTEWALQRALELNPLAADAWIMLSVFESRRRDGSNEYRGSMETTERALRQAEQLGASNPRLALNWADLHARRFEFMLAERSVRQALAASALDSRSAGLGYRQLAHYYRQRELRDLPAARRALEAALEIEPQNPWNWVQYSAFLLEERGDAKGAGEAARRALCLYPLAEANRRLAYALYFDWARDNLKNPKPKADERAREAYARYPHWRQVMAYAADYTELAPLVEMLVRVGAPVDEADPYDSLSALGEAVSTGRVPDAARLIELGANVNQSSKHGALLGLAASEGSADMVRLLLKHGADIDALADGRTALLAAIGARDVPMVELLLSAGADPNVGDGRGETPLSFAALNPLGSLDIVRMLLRAGADPAYEYLPGQPLAESAKHIGLPGAAELLEQAMMDSRRQP
jgi:tetratricopeptide (TPR) repeat protein